MAEKVFSFQKSNMVFEEGDVEDEEVGVLDDSDEDPTFDMVEETRWALSKISLKKSKRRSSRKGSESGNEDGLESEDVVIPELDEKDGRCFEIVEKLIKDGQVAKLKVDQCKVYLRKYGLRLTGNKEVLLGRIREHLEVKDGGGEKKYPASSFVLNCKGDACTGDIVMFEQKVYEMYNIASRSATGPPCGTRIVAGRIVKESYGAAKQQHTFTIEVLWSKGEKPLPPLHPLLIKGRNLYRLKTMRQRWTDEEKRRKILQEKHARGSIARCNRDNRIQEKETKKMGNTKRMKENKGNHILEGQENKKQGNPVQRTVLQQPKYLSSQQPQPHPGLIKSKVVEQPVEQKYPEHYLNCYPVSKPCQGQFERHKNPPSKIVVQQPKFESLQQSQHHPGLIRSEISEQQKLQHSGSRYVEPNAREHCVNFYPVSKPYHEEAEAYHNNRQALQPRPCNPSSSRAHFHPRQPGYHQHHWQNTYCSHDKQALESFNSFGPHQNSRYVSPEQELCRYYRQGRCYFGENCKYLHVYNQSLIFN